MIATRYISTEGLEVPTEKLLKEKENLKQVRSIEFPRTSSEFQSVTTTPKICSAYSPLFYTFLQRFAMGEKLEYEQFFRIKGITANYRHILQSILDISRREDSSSYSFLEFYVFRRRSEVIKFLMDNPLLFQILQEAYEKIRNYFGKSTQVVLEVVTDPEVARDQELVIFVQTNLSPDEALKRLGQLDEEWWLDVPANVREKLCINVEFI